MSLSDDQQDLNQYLQDHSTPENSLLVELSRHTYLHEVHPQMLSGQVLGLFLRMISQMIKPQYILEIGTFSGYSAICLSEGLRSDGKLVTIEINDEQEDICRHFFQKAGIEASVELIIGDALKVIPDLNYSFELVYIDANKEQYPDYYNLVIQKVRQGGYIIIDNVLWDGRVSDPSDRDPTTRTLDRFNKMIRKDKQVENLLLPVRDGIMLIKKL